MISGDQETSQWQRDEQPQTDEELTGSETWHWWNNFRCIANYEKKLNLALELTADLPNQAAIDRWLGEPIKCLIIPTHLFMSNKKGFPVLSKSHQNVIHQFSRLKTQILITGALRHQHIKHYQQYMDHLWQVLLAFPFSNRLLNFSAVFLIIFLFILLVWTGWEPLRSICFRLRRLPTVPTATAHG